MNKLNEKGFTLIELLAVITIMGILILVAIPTVSRTIENSRKDTFIDTAKQYVSGAKNMWISDDLTCSVGGDSYLPSAVPAGAYYIPVDTSNSSHSLLLEQGGKSSWGKRDVKGYVLVYIEEVAGNRKISYYPVLVDGVHGVNASDALTLSDKIVRGDLQMSGASYDLVDTSSGVFVTIDEKELTAAVCNAPQKGSSGGTKTSVWEIVSGDINTIGSEVAIGDEHFYVIGYNGDNAILFAQYNLYVGNKIVREDAWEYLPLDNPTGLQSSTAKGHQGGSGTLFGCTAFSTTGTSYSGSIVEGYVNDYATYLRGQGANIAAARLISVDEMVDLGCEKISNYYSCYGVSPKWVYNISYWTGDAMDSSKVWMFDMELSYLYVANYSHDIYGVRPVIEVPMSDF